MSLLVDHISTLRRQIMANIFDKAKASKQTAPAKPAKKDDKLHLEVPDLGLFCRLKAAAATIAGVIDTVEEDVKNAVRSKFNDLRKNGTKPDSFRGVDKDDVN